MRRIKSAYNLNAVELISTFLKLHARRIPDREFIIPQFPA